MYYFKDTKKYPLETFKFIPTSAMFYDGLLLEDLIEGYTTLKVEGREMTSLTIDSTAVKVGAIVSNQKINTRSITVTYQLKNKSSQAIQDDFKKMMAHLYREEDVAIYFEDEPTTLYYGRYHSAESVDGSSNSIISSFTIFCSDPYKYGSQIVSTGVINTVLRQPVMPIKIEATVTKSGPMRIVKGSQSISMSRANFKVGDKVIVDFVVGKVFVNNLNRTRFLDLDSDFSNFKLNSNDKITCTSANLKIYYRSVDL